MTNFPIPSRDHKCQKVAKAWEECKEKEKHAMGIELQQEPRDSIDYKKILVTSILNQHHICMGHQRTTNEQRTLVVQEYA